MPKAVICKMANPDLRAMAVRAKRTAKCCVCQRFNNHRIKLALAEKIRIAPTNPPRTQSVSLRSCAATQINSAQQEEPKITNHSVESVLNLKSFLIKRMGETFTKLKMGGPPKKFHQWNFFIHDPESHFFGVIHYCTPPTPGRISPVAAARTARR